MSTAVASKFFFKFYFFASSLQKSRLFLVSAADFSWKPLLQRCCLGITLPLRCTLFIQNSLLLRTLFSKLLSPDYLSRFRWRYLLFRKQKRRLAVLPRLHTKDFDVRGKKSITLIYRFLIAFRFISLSQKAHLFKHHFFFQTKHYSNWSAGPFCCDWSNT